MLQAQARPQTVSSTIRLRSVVTKSPLGLLPRQFEMTYQSVEIDGSSFYRDGQDVVVAQLAEALRLADLRGKQELFIANIAPWIRVGQDDTGKVPIIQDRIETRLRAACERLQREMPVCRLDLNRGEFGIRCYLGKNRPTDYIHEEDLFSDSR